MAHASPAQRGSIPVEGKVGGVGGGGARRGVRLVRCRQRLHSRKPEAVAPTSLRARQGICRSQSNCIRPELLQRLRGEKAHRRDSPVVDPHVGGVIVNAPRVLQAERVPRDRRPGACMVDQTSQTTDEYGLPAGSSCGGTEKRYVHASRLWTAGRSMQALEVGWRGQLNCSAGSH